VGDKRVGGIDGIVGRLRAWIETLGIRGRRDMSPARRRSGVPLGRRGERAAARHLRRAGYRLLARNFRAAGAEIDLIAADGATIVFVEVKTRVGIASGRPEEAVDARKQERIRRAAEVYLGRHRAGDRPVRFDVIAITGRGFRRRLELFKDAF
jgi:putative endonuclease